MPDDGPVGDITSWIAWDDGVLWQGDYFGLSRYDGSRWRTWQETKSPLVSNFINFIWARGRIAWIGTDRGVTRHRQPNVGQLYHQRKRSGAGRDHPPGAARRKTDSGDKFAK